MSVKYYVISLIPGKKEGGSLFYDVVSLEDSIRCFTVLSTIRLHIFFTKQFLISLSCCLSTNSNLMNNF